MELYKIICLIAAAIVVLFIILFIMRDLFVDMRSKNISQISKKREKSNKIIKSDTLRKSKFKVYEGSKKKTATITNHRVKTKLVKIK